MLMRRLHSVPIIEYDIALEHDNFLLPPIIHERNKEEENEHLNVGQLCKRRSCTASLYFRAAKSHLFHPCRFARMIQPAVNK